MSFNTKKVHFKIWPLVLTILYVTFLLMSGCTNKEKNSNTNQPNVILIMSDDQGFETVGAYGGESYETPNLDNLAETGIKFTQAHATPVCTPTRVKLMSGQYGTRNFVGPFELDPAIYTFGNLFRDNNYKTFIGGKWQLSGIKENTNYGDKYLEEIFKKPIEAGFDEYALWQLTRSVGERANRYANPVLCINDKVSKYDGEYGPDIINRHVLNFIQGHKDEPFFVYYPMILTHWPFEPTPDSPDWNPNFRKDDNFEEPFGGSSKGNQVYYKGMVEYADKLVGRIVEKLEDLGLRENTLIIFTSDNGTDQGLKSILNGKDFFGGKFTNTDAGTHVPLIANWPGVIPEGSVNEDLICFTYFFPTLAEIANLKIPSNLKLDGQSFAPVLYGREADLRDWLYMWWYRDLNQGGEFARTKRYKLYHDGSFFDLKKDPLEKKLSLDINELTNEQIEVKEKLSKIIETYTQKGFERNW
jgi:arylsulfatase A